MPLILSTPRHHIMRSIVEGAASQLGVAANVVLEIDGTLTIRTAVLDGYGHTILGRAVSERDFPDDLRMCRIVHPELFRRIILQRSDVAINQVAMSRISETIKKVAAELIASNVWRKVGVTP